MVRRRSPAEWPPSERQRRPAFPASASGGAGTLYLVPTPIGNLEDMTLRAIRVLREADWVAAEDTRRARVLFQAHEIRTPLISHHAHNEHREVPRLVERLRRGETGALITDAGMPGISDPGFLLARAARAEGVPVVVLPGASAVLAALVASGFPTEPFSFVGYLPATAGRRRKMLEELALDTRTIVAFETPHRLHRALADALAIMPGRGLAMVRELTKTHEQVLTGTAAEILAALPDPLRGEIVLVLGPAREKDADRSSDQRGIDRPGPESEKGNR